MFTGKFEATLAAPKGKLKDKKGRSTKTIEFVLRADFDDTVGSGLGSSGKKAQSELKKRGLSKCEIPFDAVTANVKLNVGGKEATISNAVGIKIVARANMNDLEKPPVCDLHWRIPFDHQTWKFLGEHFGTTAQVRILRQQQVLDFDEDGNPAETRQRKQNDPTSLKPKKAKEKKATKKADGKTPENVTPITSATKPN